MNAGESSRSKESPSDRLPEDIPPSTTKCASFKKIIFNQVKIKFKKFKPLDNAYYYQLLELLMIGLNGD